MPVVVYYGDESFLLEQAAQTLRQETVNPAMAGLCHRVYSQPSLAAVLEAVGSMSLSLGGQTLVEIRDFAMLAEASKDAATDAQLEELKAILENVEPTKTVLFLSRKIDGKIRFPKWLVHHKGFTVRKFESFKFWETDKATDFLVGIARERGITLAEDAAELLVNSIGVELRLLVNELDKLALYALDRPITKGDVMRMCNHSDNLFQLINRWILREHPSENYRDLAEILLKRHSIEIFATVQSYFNNIFRTMWLSAQGATMDTIAQRTGQKPFTIKKQMAQFRQVPLERWTKLKHLLVELEWKMKTGQIDGQLALDVLLGS